MQLDDGDETAHRKDCVGKGDQAFGQARRKPRAQNPHTLGYVINVIENPAERRETLRRAWSLAERVLIVSARLVAEAASIRRPKPLPMAI